MIVFLYFLMVLLEMLTSSFSFFSRIDFVFIFLFIVSFSYSPTTSLLFAFFSGVFVDFYYSFAIGLHSMIYLLLSYIISRIKANIDLTFIFSRFFNFVVFNILLTLASYIGSYLAAIRIDFSWSQVLLYPFVNFVFFEVIRALIISRRKEYGVC